MYCIQLFFFNYQYLPILFQALYCILPTVCEAVGPSGPSDSYVAYLPLAHILEYLAGEPRAYWITWQVRPRVPGR